METSVQGDWCCDKRMLAIVSKWKIYNIIVGSPMMHVVEMVELTKRHEAELEVRFLLGVTRMDTIRKEYIRGTVKVRGKVREARLRRSGHLQMRSNG